jgi:hypothetical protein
VRIFLSYASERRAAAEPIALALRGRGHAVFFDKDDLPGAESYDAQIETAVGESDLMIFLISPESVEPGRYTLTELAFARHRWRSARGRVLPVLIAPTPLERTPAYLTSVQILKPEGNAAAGSPPSWTGSSRSRRSSMRCRSRRRSASRAGWSPAASTCSRR